MTPTPSTGARERSFDLRLPPALDMRHARDLKRSLEALLESGKPAAIEASSVSRVSTGCLLLLTAFVGSMTKNGVSVTLLQPSSVILDGLADLGLSDTLAKCRTE